MNELESLRKEVNDLREEVISLKNSVGRDRRDVWKMINDICDKVGGFHGEK